MGCGATWLRGSGTHHCLHATTKVTNANVWSITAKMIAITKQPRTHGSSPLVFSFTWSLSICPFLRRVFCVLSAMWSILCLAFCFIFSTPIFGGLCCNLYEQINLHGPYRRILSLPFNFLFPFLSHPFSNIDHNQAAIPP